MHFSVVDRFKRTSQPVSFGWLFVFTVTLVGSYVGFGPLRFIMPDYELDDSWAAVLGEAHRRGFKFGEDIVSTGGPLSAIYSHYFQEDLFWIVLALNVL